MSGRSASGVAIVGMACRYADARSPAELWEGALAGRRGFRRMPPERLRLADYARPGDPEGIYATEAAVLEGWEFDRLRFRVAGAAFRAADLAHWLALEVAADALADAGHAEGGGLPRESTGVLVGNTLTGEFSRAGLLRLRWPYVRRTVAAALAGEGWERERAAAFLDRLEAAYKAPFPETTEESLAGGLSNTIAGRIANHFDLHGGGYTVDGACASSLLAVANACSALAAGDLDVALAGGVDLSLDPFELAGFARNGALSHGEMRVYDRRADGFIPGEGCGFVALMREDEARAAGRRVYAVVRGWGISSDGHGGISRPEEAGQLLAISRAYRRAGFGIETVGYFEGHGTGTAVGDATELAALARARREAGAREAAAIGSAKALLGHTKAAAGVAGLIRAALALGAQVVPPMPAAAGGDEPAPEVAPGGALYVPRAAEAWPAERPLRAGVSAMGFGGINVHLAVEGDGEARARRGMSERERRAARSYQDCELLVFAAADAAALKAEIARAAEVVEKVSRAELGDLAAELARRVGRGAARAAVVAATPREAAERLTALAGWLQAREGREEGKEKALGKEASRLPRGVFAGQGTAAPPRVGLLFPGQGSPARRDGGIWRRRFEWSEDLWTGGEDGSEVGTGVAQPAILAAEIAGLRALDRLGIAGEVAVGHSLGEIAALCWAGGLGEREAIELARGRGRAMAAIGGAMASLGAGVEAVRELLGEIGGEAVIAAENGPLRTVVSGSAEGVERAAERAAARGWAVHRLRVSHAFHSPSMAGAQPRLRTALDRIGWAPVARRVASTVSGDLLPEDADLSALLAAQLTSPVRFAAALDAARPHADLWIEVGPGRALAELAAEMTDAPVISLDAGGPSLAGLLGAAAACFAAGVAVDLAPFFADRLTRPFDLTRPLRFLASPCEAAPIEADSEAGKGIAASQERAREAPAGEAMSAAGPLEAPLALLRRLVAERAELPAAAVAGESRLLADLHLNSIAVGQLVVEASRRLGLPAPAAPADYAQATVAEIAEALAARAATGEHAERDDGRPPAGVAPWVRAFTVEHVPQPLPERPRRRAASQAGAWRVIAPPDDAVAQALPAALQEIDGPAPGVALCLPPEPDADPTAAVDLFVAAARAILAAPRPTRFLLVQHGASGGGAFARTLHLELEGVTTAVVDLPPDMEPRRAAALAAGEAAAARRYVEARYSADGERSVPRLAPLSIPLSAPDAAAADLPLDVKDVLLVSGGGKGIGAECALALARASGARLAILGRSDPEEDEELAANLARMAAAGAPALYLRADVADAARVAGAVARAAEALGPVTALLHAAGANRPRPLSDLDRDGFLATLAPKVEGARNLLAALDPAALRLAVGFGSIIARAGLPGEADYAVANDWLGAILARHAAAHPSCRCLTVDWSVWAGAGMGERLGTLAALDRADIAAIPLDAGVRALAALLARPGIPAQVVVAGRFGAPPTLEIAPPPGAGRELPLRRFLERPRVYYPGVELVADARLSADTDPYLADHVFRGEPLFPAVLGLEAMAQAAMVLAGASEPPVFEDIELRRPIAVAPGSTTTLRVAALVREDGAVEVALRDEAAGFAADCFRAVCRFDRPPLADAPAIDLEVDGILAIDSPGESVLAIDPEISKALEIDPNTDLYDGGILFHAGRFRRLREYRSLSATACRAAISADGTSAWFGAYLPGELALGDPGARDAAIHGIQACIPHAHLLPVGVERIVAGRLPAGEPLALAARERWRQGSDFVYDLSLRDASGRLVERWEGLRLRAVDPAPAPAAWPAPLLAPYLERRLEEILPGAGLRVALAPGGAPAPSGRADSAPAVAHLLPGSILLHRPDGRPEVAGGPPLSIAHAGSLVLAVVAGVGAAVGCDLEPVASRETESWRGLLGDERLALARLLARELGEDGGAAATRVWAATEALVKAGAGSAAPLAFEAKALAFKATSDAGWTILRAGRWLVATAVVAVRGLGRAAFAVAVETEERESAAAEVPRDLGRELPALAGGGDA